MCLSEAAKQSIVLGPVGPCVAVCPCSNWKNYWAEIDVTW